MKTTFEASTVRSSSSIFSRSLRGLAAFPALLPLLAALAAAALAAPLGWPPLVDGSPGLVQPSQELEASPSANSSVHREW
jgi:hypothetical protein